MNWSFIINQTVSSAFSPAAIAFVLAAQGLNMHFGYTGLMNFGQAGFMAMGAYGVAIGVDTFGWSMWAGIALGVAAAVALALIMGAATLRLRGDYLAIVTIAAAEIIRISFRSEKLEGFSGGNSGINGFARTLYELNPFQNGARYKFGPFDYLGKDLWVQLIGWSLVIVVAVITFLLMRSPWGRVLRSIRENEDAVRSLGKNVYAFKMQSLILGAVYGALGGMVLAMSQNFAGPDDFTTKATFISYTALILGGAATVGGPIIGGIMFYSLFTFTLQLASQATEAKLLPQSVMNDVQAGVMPFLVLGLSLMLLVVFRPQGIFGNRREVELDAR